MIDQALLQQFAVSADATAFAELVRRHGPMVHSAAKRLAGDDADDVAQAVFILLSRKAAQLAGRPCIAGWLYEATRLCAGNARRSRLRRRRLTTHLAETAMRRTPSPTSQEPAWVAVLDEGLSRLPAAERDVILLRYIEGLSAPETASSLAITPAAVTKRTSRAIARMRAIFRQRGFSITAEQTATMAFLKAGPLTAEQVAKLSHPPLGPASQATALADSTAHAMTVARAKAVAALILAAAAAVAVTVVGGTAMLSNGSLKAHGVVATSAPADKPPDALDQRTPAVASASSGDTSGDAKFESCATRFLIALRDRQVDVVADLLAASSTKIARDKAAALVATVQEAYALDPTRIANRQGTFKEWDASRTLIEGGVEVVPPIVADLQHLTIRIVQVNGDFRVSEASISTSGFMLDRAADPRPLDEHRARHAYAAWQHWTTAAQTPWIADPSDVRATARMHHVLKSYRDGLPDMLTAMRETGFAVPPDALPSLSARLIEMEKELDGQGLSAVEKQLDGSGDGTLPYLLSCGDKLRVRAADEEADAAEPVPARRPTPAEPNAKIPLANGDVLEVPGPLNVPNWVESLPSYKHWRTAGGDLLLQTIDNAGQRYVLSLASTPALDKQPAATFITIRQYRPDGTLAAVTDRRDTTAQDWQLLDTTGTRYVWRIYKAQRGVSGESGESDKFSRIEHFDPDGSQHAYIFDGDGRYSMLADINPTGHLLQQTHADGQ